MCLEETTLWSRDGEPTPPRGLRPRGIVQNCDTSTRLTRPLEARRRREPRQSRKGQQEGAAQGLLGTSRLGLAKDNMSSGGREALAKRASTSVCPGTPPMSKALCRGPGAVPVLCGVQEDSAARSEPANFQMHKLDLEKAEKPENKLPTFTESQKKQENSRKIPTSVLLTTLKPLTVWITTN